MRLPKMQRLLPRVALVAGLAVFTLAASAATTLPRYYAHPAVHDAHGVIAPWYAGLNGQCDSRVRLAAETLKRYPWTTTNQAIAAYPAYVFSGFWQISSNGLIAPKTPNDWGNGDLGQRATSVFEGLVDYYRYTGDPAAIAHLTYMASYLLDHCLTPPDHPWPGMFISVPVKGKPFGKCDPKGMIQLDICASTGRGLLRAYQLTGEPRWFAAARQWGDVLAAKCDLAAGADPWPRYANPENAPWKDNKQTGGVTMILAFLDELIRLGYYGRDNRLLAARDAGRRYLREQLLPAWTADDTWGRYFWDWPNPTQNCLTTPDAARYLLEHPAEFPNWRHDARNILMLFLHRSTAAPDSNGDVYSGAWAYPESSSCCGRSLWYAPLCVAPTLAQYASLTGSLWAREVAYRQLVLQTYDAHENGVTEDNIDGGIIVNGDWFNIAHPLALRFVLAAIGWLPEELGANRENHIVRSTAVIRSVIYGGGRIEYVTFDAPADTVEVLRLAFTPVKVSGDGRSLERRNDLGRAGYIIKNLPNGDAIVSVRHDGAKHIVVTGSDPQKMLDDAAMAYEGTWQTHRENAAFGGAVHFSESTNAMVTAMFTGNQVRVIGRVDRMGGAADVYLDGIKQWTPIDCWNPSPRHQQVLFYRNGLVQGDHVLKIITRGTGNPYGSGSQVCIDAMQYSAATGAHHFPTGGGPTESQRLIFGYTGRQDYRDSSGQLWRPAMELVTRAASGSDTLAKFWLTNPAPETITGTADPLLYRYGVQGRDFWVNLTVGPGKYHARLKLAATRQRDTRKNCFHVRINDRQVVTNLDVVATAGGPDRAVDLVFNDIAPHHGIIEIRFTGARTMNGGKLVQGEAFIQALEVGPGVGGTGAQPVSVPVSASLGNLLLNPGFEETVGGTQGGPGARSPLAEWTIEFAGPARSYVWQEEDYRKHPDWGLPEFHSGKGALRTHTDSTGHTRIYQEADVAPNTAYLASVWVRAADLRGKGFGRHTNDSAGLVIWELDDVGKVVQQHEKTGIKTAGPYQKLTQRFTTSPAAKQVRFILDSVMHCPYAEGHVTYDDCVLEAGPRSEAKPPSIR